MSNPRKISSSSVSLDVYFEDIDAKVCSQSEAWVVYNGKWLYYSNETAAKNRSSIYTRKRG